MPRFEICFKVGDNGASSDGRPIGWARNGHYLTPAEYLAWFESTGTEDHPDLAHVPQLYRTNLRCIVRRNRRWLSSATDTELAQERYSLGTGTPNADQMERIEGKRATATAQHAKILDLGIDTHWGFKEKAHHAQVLIDFTWQQLYEMFDPTMIISESNPLAPRPTIRQSHLIDYAAYLSPESTARVRDRGEIIHLRRRRGDGSERPGFDSAIAVEQPYADERV